MLRSGGEIVADHLLAHGIELAFCVPGESYLPLLDALHDRRERLRLVTCRHEAAAATAAEAAGKLTGRPGVALVTRGPGATHAAIGVHAARMASTPLLLLVGQVAREHRHREAFQEVDYAQAFGPLAKWACEVDQVERLPELLARAVATATSGRPGPVVLALPEDVLAESCDVPDAAPVRAARSAPDAAALDALWSELERAQRPLLVVGGGPWDQDASDALTAWATASELPFAVGMRRQDVVDNDAPCYVGELGFGIDPRLAARVQDADLIVALGARLSDVQTQGYELLDVPRPAQRLVHVLADPAELGRVYQPDLAIVSDPRAFAHALAQRGPHPGAERAAWRAAARADREADLSEQAPVASGVDLTAVVRHLDAVLPDDAIVTNGAGNYTTWVQRYRRFRRVGTQLAPQSGGMGYGLPAALAAALVRPTSPVVCFAGDGCFQMSGQELATAVQEQLPIVVIVVDNGVYGTIRMHQERRYPGRPIGTSLRNPDFVALARAYGAWAQRVEHAGDFPAAFAAARAAGGPALIQLVTDPEAISPRTTLSAIRAAAEEA